MWHLRYGHPGFYGLKLLSKTKMVDGLLEINEPENLCEACVKGKQHRQSFPVRKWWISRRPLEIVHTDIAGPFDISSLGGNRYYLTFIDDFSRNLYILSHAQVGGYCWVYLMISTFTIRIWRSNFVWDQYLTSTEYMRVYRQRMFLRVCPTHGW